MKEQHKVAEATTDWRSLTIASIIALFTAIQFTIYFSSLWPYLIQVSTGPTSDRIILWMDHRSVQPRSSSYVCWIRLPTESNETKQNTNTYWTFYDVSREPYLPPM
ncbi:hypothetical protein Y032_0072g701 [Ancylostoma ceylanicum]|nr:hypothetical protein Y032_0072g701 [Ancylostoma ceylanicum]